MTRSLQLQSCLTLLGLVALTLAVSGDDAWTANPFAGVADRPWMTYPEPTDLSLASLEATIIPTQTEWMRHAGITGNGSLEEHWANKSRPTKVGDAVRNGAAR